MLKLEPSTQALNLINKFHNPIAKLEDPARVLQSEEYALITVKEIIASLNNIPDLYVVGNYLLDELQYWKKVKLELDNYEPK
jgi:hypothetical protein